MNGGTITKISQPTLAEALRKSLRRIERDPVHGADHRGNGDGQACRG